MRCDYLIGVEGQNPLASTFVDRGVDLRAITLPWLNKDAGIELARDVEVSSVEPESTTTISSTQATLARVRRRLAASLQATMGTEILTGISLNCKT